MNKHFPYGYQPNQDGLPVLDPNKAPYVKEMFDKYLEGICQMDIMKWLIKVGATPPRVQWGHSNIGHILSNSKYCGEEGFPEIVTKEVFLEVQKKRYNHNRYLSSYYNNTPYAKRKAYAFTSKIFCSECNKALISHQEGTKTINKKQIWRCGNYIMNGKVYCRTAIDNGRLEELFIEVFGELYKKFDTLIERVERKEKPKTNNQILSIDLQIKDKLAETALDRESILELLSRRTSAVWTIAVADDFEHQTFKLKEVLNTISEAPEYFDGDLFNSTVKQVTLYPKGKVAFIFLNGISIERTI